MKINEFWLTSTGKLFVEYDDQGSLGIRKIRRILIHFDFTDL